MKERYMGYTNQSDMKYLCVGLDSWAGCTFHPIQIIKETPKRYKVKWLGKSVFRFIQGETFYVPKSSVTQIEGKYLTENERNMEAIDAWNTRT